MNNDAGGVSAHERPVGRPVPERAAYDAWYVATTFETMGHEWTWAGWQAGAAWQRGRDLRNARRRANRARDFPENTCPASRHMHLMAEQLASGKPYPMLNEDPLHCALTMLAVLESLWKARTELARLKTPNAEVRRPQGRSDL